MTGQDITLYLEKLAKNYPSGRFSTQRITHQLGPCIGLGKRLSIKVTSLTSSFTAKIQPISQGLHSPHQLRPTWT
jgi:hypothetical protein